MLSAASASASRPRASVASATGTRRRALAVRANGGRRGRRVNFRSLGVPCRIFVLKKKVGRTLVCEAAERVNACTRGVREGDGH
jgi:hypothetical protein